MQTFCTIITPDYLPFAKTLFKSLQRYDSNISLHVLITGSNQYLSEGSFILINLPEITNAPLFKEVEKKYAHTNSDYFRWALKPILIGFLLNKGFSKVIFTDPDIYFTGNYQFLFDKLDNSSILLTPHWIDTNPYKLEASLIHVFRGGIFNAGFVAANQKGLPAIEWWAEACHFRVDKQPEIGIYVDQKYLDLLPIEYENVEIIRHKGCNLASWNMDSCKRTMTNGKLLINKRFEPVFIHFTKETIENIINANDNLLQPFLDDYINCFKEQGYNFKELIKEGDITGHYSAVAIIRRKLLLRTRIKRWLLKLSQKL